MSQNIAVIGCGHWGKNLIRNFFELDALFAVCDPDKKLAKKYSSQYSVENLSFKEILNHDSVEGVVLAVPAPLHSKMAIEAMNHKKSVFVEKPIAMNEKEAIAMLDSAKKNKSQLMVGHLLQYHPVFIALKNLIDSGELGNLQYIYSNRLSFGKLRSHENVIWSFAPHDISMVLSIAGREPNNVRVESSAIIQQDIADFATLHMDFGSNLKGHIYVSWLHPYKEQKLVVIGKEAMIVFDDTKQWSEKLALYRHSVDIKEGLPTLSKANAEFINVPESEPLRNECKHFMEVVAGIKNPLTDGHEGLRVLNVLTSSSKLI